MGISRFAWLAEAVQINVDARLKAPTMGLPLMFVFPARWLPKSRPGDIPNDPAPLSPEELRRSAAEV